MRRHLTYANVAATLALVFAMSGGAIAAKHYLINSTKQINPKVLKKLHGATGKTGSQGPAGKAGAPGRDGAPGKNGERGPSTAFTAQADSVGFPLGPNIAEVVAMRKLPPGGYTVLATVTAHNESNLFTEAGCVLLFNAGESTIFGEASTSLEGKSTPGARRSMALSGTLTPQTEVNLELVCKTPVTEGKYEAVRLIATEVGSIG